MGGKLVGELLDELLVEKLAALSHEQWSGWARWMIEKYHQQHPSGEDYFVRWVRQIGTPYAELSEAEKESDRVEARKVLAVFRSYMLGAYDGPRDD